MFQKLMIQKSALKKTSRFTKIARLSRFILAGAVLAGCSQQSVPLSSAVTEDCQKVVHDAGETEICGQPQRIVTIGPNLLELLLALEVQPIGHAEYFPIAASTFEEPAQEIPYLGKRLTGKPQNVGTAHDPSIEAIAALKPDLILADSFKNKDEYALLSKIAPTLLFNYSDAERDWQNGLRAIATPLDKAEQAETLITEASQRLTTARNEIQLLAANYPNVLMLLSEKLEQAIDIETPSSACGGLVEDLGFQLIVPDSLENSEQTSATLSLEVIPQLEADLIIIEGYNSDVDISPDVSSSDPVDHQLRGVKQQWKENAIAQSMPATQDGRVYFTTTYLCHGLLGPIGTDIFLEQFQQQLQPLTKPQSS